MNDKKDIYCGNCGKEANFEELEPITITIPNGYSYESASGTMKYDTERIFPVYRCKSCNAVLVFKIYDGPNVYDDLECHNCHETVKIYVETEEKDLIRFHCDSCGISFTDLDYRD